MKTIAELNGELRDGIERAVESWSPHCDKALVLVGPSAEDVWMCKVYTYVGEKMFGPHFQVEERKSERMIDSLDAQMRLASVVVGYLEELSKELRGYFQVAMRAAVEEVAADILPVFDARFKELEATPRLTHADWMDEIQQIFGLISGELLGRTETRGMLNLAIQFEERARVLKPLIEEAKIRLEADREMGRWLDEAEAAEAKAFQMEVEANLNQLHNFD